MPKLSAEKLQAVAERILRAAGAPWHVADAVARHLVDADLCGYSTHGVSTIPNYVDEVAAGRIVPNAEPEVSKIGAGFIQVEGRKTFGHYAIDWLIPQVVAQLNSQAVCLVTVRNIGHIGRLGGYVEALALQGCVAIMTASYALDDYESVVAPVGSATRRLGTNPVAIAVPTTSAPFAYDASTAAGTVFSIINAARSHTLVPPDILLNAQGSPTTDPQDFFAGGVILPFGKHKGFGLSAGLCLLAALSGDCDPATGRFGGVALLAIKIDAFMPSNDYIRGVGDFLSILRATPPLPGSTVRIPGDRAHTEREQRRAEGVYIAPEIWNLLMKCQDELGLSNETLELEGA